MIIRQEDLVNGGEIVLITGKVERIKIVEAEQTAKNIEFGVTHTASIVVDNTWINYISLGVKEGREPNIAINTGTKASPKWERIEEGDEVKVVVSETKKGDKTYYNAKRTGIKLVKKGAGGSSSGGTQGSYTPKPKSSAEGVSTGHAFNGAMNFLLTQGVEPSNENIIKYAQSVHNVTEKVKKATEAKNSGMDAYSVGAMSGNAILNACKLIDPNGNFEQQLETLATDFLDNVVPKIAGHVKGEEKPAPAAKVTKSPPAKRAATKATPVEPDEPDFEDDSEELPF